jgi:two-component system invasion response regulator UvrY
LSAIARQSLRSFIPNDSAEAIYGTADVKILVVDDHLAVREGVHGLFTAIPGAEIFDAASAQEALSVYRAKAPDVVLMDINLPDSTGFELLSSMLMEDELAKIVVFSVHVEPIYVSRTFTAGARGYVSKGASTQELIDAVQAVAAGGRYIEREIATQMVLSPSGGDNPLEKLTAREIDIVRLLAAGKNPAAIALALGITHKTVANSCSIIKSKLGTERTSDLIRLLYQMEDFRSATQSELPHAGHDAP